MATRDLAATLSPPSRVASDDPDRLRWLLVLLTAIGPVSFQIFLPSLPAIQRGFEVEPAVAQLALSLSMLGIAVATLAYGGLSDRFGRRPVLIGGMAVLLAGSVACALAPSIEWLIVGRIVQAAGGAAGMVVTRAVVIDLYGRERAGKVMAWLLAAMMIAPMLATPVGGLLNDYLGWRWNFATVAVLAAVMLATVVLRLPETRDAGHVASGGLGGYGELLRSRCFLGFALQGAFAMAAFIAFNTASPYFLTGGLGLSATRVGLLFVLVSLGFAGGSLLAVRMPDSIGLRRRVLVGSVVGLVAGGLAAMLALVGVATWWALVGPAALFAFATGITMPASQAGAIGAVPRLAGTASGLSGFLGTLLGAGATQLVGSLSDGSQYPVALAMALLATLSLVAVLVALNSRGAPGVVPAKA